MNKTRILLIIAIVVSEIFTIIQFRGKGDSAKSYSLLEEQISSETAVVSELNNELETLKSEIISLSGKIDGVDQEIEDLSSRKAELEDLLAKKAEEAKTEPKQEEPKPAPAIPEAPVQSQDEAQQALYEETMRKLAEMGAKTFDEIPSGVATNNSGSGEHYGNAE